MTRTRSIMLLGTTFLSLGACGGPTEPKAGTVNFQLSRAAVPLAGILIEVTGTGIDAVTASTGSLDALDVAPNRRVVLLSGNLTEGTSLLNVQVSDLSQRPAVRVLQAALGSLHGFANVSPSAVEVR